VRHLLSFSVLSRRCLIDPRYNMRQTTIAKLFLDVLQVVVAMLPALCLQL
jgi:hypothetical protein